MESFEIIRLFTDYAGGIVVLGIGIIWLIISITCAIHFKDSRYAYIGALCLFVCMLATILLLVEFHVKDNKNQRVIDKAEQGYVVYLDGVEVDIHNVDLNHYFVTINEDEHKILISSKHGG